MFKTEEQIIEYILSERADLAEAVKERNIRNVALRLMDWTSGFVNYSWDDLIFDPKNRDFVESFNILHQKQNGLWCGGTAVFFRDLLRLFGIPSATFKYKHTEESRLSHVTTMYCDVTDNTFGIYLLDAYLNTYYMDAETGEMLYFEKLLEYILQNQYHMIRTVISPVRRSYLLRERIDPYNAYERTRLYPGASALPEPVRHGDIWEYQNARAMDLETVKYLWRQWIDRYCYGRSDEEFMFDLMLSQPVLQEFGIAEVDYEMQRLIENVRIITSNSHISYTGENL